MIEARIESWAQSGDADRAEAEEVAGRVLEGIHGVRFRGVVGLSRQGGEALAFDVDGVPAPMVLVGSRRYVARGVFTSDRAEGTGIDVPAFLVTSRPVRESELTGFPSFEGDEAAGEYEEFERAARHKGLRLSRPFEFLRVVEVLRGRRDVRVVSGPSAIRELEATIDVWGSDGRVCSRGVDLAGDDVCWIWSDRSGAALEVGWSKDSDLLLGSVMRGDGRAVVLASWMRRGLRLGNTGAFLVMEVDVY